MWEDWKALSRCSSLGSSWEDERMDRSDPAGGASGHLLNFLRQYGLALPKPRGSKEEARRGIAQAAAFIWEILPGSVASCKARQRAKDNANCRAHRKRKRLKKWASTRQAAKKRRGAKGRQSHNLLQHFIRNTRNTQVGSSESKHLSVSTWSKFEHRFSHAVSAILDADYL